MSDVFTLRGPVKKDRPELAERSIERKSVAGAVLGTVKLEPLYFGRTPNMAVLHQVIKAQLAAKRSGTQSTKTRAEVRGGGKKPFNQKGTGGARQGTIRAPHYPGGGIALGPKPRSYEQKVNKKMVRLALYSALSDRAELGQVALVDNFDAWTGPKTKDATAFLAALELKGKILMVVSSTDEIATRSFRNLMNVKTIDAGELNAYDVLDCDWVVFTDATLPIAPTKETL
jgi:large subunit ribosomal protein L4